MQYSDIFNERTLNIFTDASIKQHQDGTYTGCPGCICVTNINGMPNIIDEDMSIELNSTNNNSEIKAIYKGVLKALQYRNDYYYINLFSDSKICIQGLREWIFSWVNNMNNGVMYNSSNKEVANQSVISDIIGLIVNNNLNINLFHQKGHVTNAIKSLQNAQRVFSISNNVNYVDMQLIQAITDFNNYVDNTTREYLDKSDVIYGPKTIMHYDIQSLDIKKYKKLIKGGK